MGLETLWTAVKLILLPVCMILYLLYQLLFYVSGGPFQTVRNYISKQMISCWENYFIHLVRYCFPSWSQVLLYFSPYILSVIFIITMGMIKPPFWSYFELPLQENERLILYPRQLMLLSSIQLNSLLQWQFQWDWIFSRGFYPLQHMVNNGCYLLSVILTHVQKLLEISKPPTAPKSDTY